MVMNNEVVYPIGRISVLQTSSKREIEHTSEIMHTNKIEHTIDIVKTALLRN
jgi:hypothetical protein